MSSSSSSQAWRVSAPARLHLGFLDPGATLGRRFGSIGLAIDELATTVVAQGADDLLIEGPDATRVAELVERLLAHYDLPRKLALEVESLIPAHAGLGSGTQLALAVGRAVLRRFGREAATGELATVLGRGKRSGAGIGLFDHGGLVVDAGHGAATRAPPLVSRLDFPPSWCVILIFDRACAGLSGGAELEAFRRLGPLSATQAAHLCHLTLMRLLPAVAERDFAPFADAVGEIQAVVGDHFAPVQCGRYSSRAVCEAVELASARHGLRGVGQSSWGPTGFVFAPDREQARAVVSTLRAGAQATLDFRIVGARNHGAEVVPLGLVQARRRAEA